MKPIMWIVVVLLAAMLLLARDWARDAVLPEAKPAPEAVATDVQLPASGLPEGSSGLGLAFAE